MDVTTFFNWIEFYKRSIQFFSAFIIFTLMVSVYFFVMATGGIKYVFSHSMYLPIVLASVIFGARGGLIVAVAGGFALGPFVPIDTVTGELQLTINWIYRIGFFSLIGLTVGLVSDGIKAYLKYLRWIARHDTSTELPNYFALEEDLNRLKRIQKKENVPLNHCLIIISLANTEEIITNFGTPALNQIIHQMSERIKRETPADTIVYRIRTDQLCLRLKEQKNIEMKSFCRTLHKTFQKAFLSKELQLHGDILLGVVKFQEVTESPDYYIQKAVNTVFDAKSSSAPNIIEITKDSDQFIIENIELLGYLKDALDRKQLQMHYQPKIDLSTGEILHVEALMRWYHPKLGNIAPGKFIPRAERSTLIGGLTEFAIDQSLGEVVKFRNIGLEIKVAVNISVQNLTQPRFVYQVMTLLEKHGLTGENLELELTENSLMHDTTRAIEVLSKLSKLGVTLSIDDFGTGYSSLQYLQKLPISIIKIDKSFILNLPNDEGSKHIVDAATNLAHKLNFKVVAEGVEDKDSLNILRNMDCDFAQGFLMSHPLPASEFATWHNKCGGRYAFI